MLQKRSMSHPTQNEAERATSVGKRRERNDDRSGAKPIKTDQAQPKEALLLGS